MCVHHIPTDKSGYVPFDEKLRFEYPEIILYLVYCILYLCICIWAVPHMGPSVPFAPVLLTLSLHITLHIYFISSRLFILLYVICVWSIKLCNGQKIIVANKTAFCGISRQADNLVR